MVVFIVLRMPIPSLVMTQRRRRRVLFVFGITVRSKRLLTRKYKAKRVSRLQIYSRNITVWARKEMSTQCK